MNINYFLILLLLLMLCGSVFGQNVLQCFVPGSKIYNDVKLITIFFLREKERVREKKKDRKKNKWKRKQRKKKKRKKETNKQINK